jgi:uncharacterized membrane protein YebE (DUF533 family)
MSSYFASSGLKNSSIVSTALNSNAFSSSTILAAMGLFAAGSDGTIDITGFC